MFPDWAIAAPVERPCGSKPIGPSQASSGSEDCLQEVFQMRPLAGPLAFVGSAASLVFWLVIPFVAVGNNIYVHAGNEPFYLAFAFMSVAGIVGALMAVKSTRWAPLLMGVAIIPGIGALFVPGLLLVIATLLALQEPEPASTRIVG
jgi:hypothetical protein